MTYDFKDKYFSILGDSISTLEGYIPAGYKCFYLHEKEYFTHIGTPEDTWWGKVLEHFGGRLLVNNSWSGSYLCLPQNIEDASCACSDSRTGWLDANGISPDHILIYIGTNDRGAGFRLRSEDKTDLSVFENAYGAMLDKIRKNYPSATVWCCTLPKTTSRGASPYGVIWEMVAEPTREIHDIICSVAKSRGCHVIDLYNNDEVCFTLDGLHPGTLGMTVISKKAISDIENT